MTDRLLYLCHRNWLSKIRKSWVRICFGIFQVVFCLLRANIFQNGGWMWSSVLNSSTITIPSQGIGVIKPYMRMRVQKRRVLTHKWHLYPFLVHQEFGCHPWHGLPLSLPRGCWLRLRPPRPRRGCAWRGSCEQQLQLQSGGPQRAGTRKTSSWDVVSNEMSFLDRKNLRVPGQALLEDPHTLRLAACPLQMASHLNCRTKNRKYRL